MTENINPPEHIDPDGDHSLSLLAHSKSRFFTVAIHDLPARRSHPVRLPTAKLLAMIDAEDPDAMRDYLRETVPEADSPEHIDERRLCDPLPVAVDARPSSATVERLSLLETVRDLYMNAPSRVHREVVEWLIDGPKR